jgi:hypothetical protein
VNRVKHILREICIVVVIAAVGYAAILGVLAYKDWRGCVCSVLSNTEQTFPIDERFYRVCEEDTLRSGTFAIIRTKCDHGNQLHLTVWQDDGVYSGYVINKD